MTDADESAHPSPQADADESAHQADADETIRKSFGGIKSDVFQSMLAHHHKLNPPGSELQKPAPTQVNVPVFLTLLVKYLQDDPDDANQATLFGTMIQRALFVPSIVKDRDDPDFLKREFFKVRVNEGLVTGEDQMCLRKASFAALTRDGEPTGHACMSSTSSFRLPMRRINVLSAVPFSISACELLVELTSYTCEMKAAEDGTKLGGEFELRPDLLCHNQDMRNLVSVRGWDTELDMAHDFDIINTSPTIEYFMNTKFKGGKPVAIYVPKVKLTFYVTKDASRHFLELISFILLCSVGNMINLVYVEPYGDFLANALTLGLTVVLMVPQMATSEKLTHNFDLNNVLTLLMVSGIIFGCIKCQTYWDRNCDREEVLFAEDGMLTMKDEPDADCETLISARMCPAWLGWAVFCFSNLCFLLAFLIPIFNGYRYVSTKHKLRRSPPPVEKPYTCNGRPRPAQKAGGSGQGKAKNIRGSVVELEHLSTFWERNEDTGELGPNKCLNNPKHFEGETPWTMTREDDGDLVVSTGIRRQDIWTVPDLTAAVKPWPQADGVQAKDTEQRNGVVSAPRRPSRGSGFFG